MERPLQVDRRQLANFVVEVRGTIAASLKDYIYIYRERERDEYIYIYIYISRKLRQMIRKTSLLKTCFSTNRYVWLLFPDPMNEIQ